MVSTEKGFSEIADLYNELIVKFLMVHKISEVVCSDNVEHFFDRIVMGKDGVMVVYKYGFKSTTFDRLYFDFTCDYAKCISNMEHDLFLQVRNGKHDKYTFTFNDEYVEPILFDCSEIDELENEYERRRNEV